MKKKTTLQEVLGAINMLSISIDKRFNGVDKKFEGIYQRLDRLETTVREIQESVEGLQNEMRGIHKVLDRFDWRITRLEKHLGFKTKGAAG